MSLPIVAAALALFCGGAREEPLDWGALTASARRDPQVAAAQGQLEELKAVRAPLLWEQLSAKWNVKRGDFKESEYDLRVSPTAWGERAANRATWEARRSLGSVQAELVLSEALLDRLHAGLDWIEAVREATYHQTLCEVYGARLQAMGKLVGDSRFDPRDLVATQLLRTETAAEVVADRNGIESLEQRMRALAPASTGPLALDTHLVSLVRVQHVVDSIGGDTGARSPELGVAGRKLELAKGMEELGRIRSCRWLDYLQVGWTWEDESIQSRMDKASSEWRKLSAEVGFVLPFLDGSSQDQARKVVAFADARGEFLRERRDFDRKVATARMTVASMLRQRAVLDSLTAKVDAGALFGAYALRSGADPLLLLQAKATSLESAWRSERLRFEILGRYLDLLHLTGGLARSVNPLRGD